MKKFSSQSVILVLMLTFACSVCVRLSANFRTKREEQMTEEEAAGETGETNLDTNKNMTYFLSVACLLVSIYLPRKWLAESGNLNSASFSTLCARYLMPVAAFATVLFWAMQHLPNKILDSLPVWQQVLLPQTVYIIVIISFIAFVISPMLVYTLPKQNNQMSIPSTQNGKDIFQKVFKYGKSNWESNSAITNDTQNDVPKVFGLGTVYSAAIMYNGMAFILLLSLLLGEGLSPSFLTAICGIFCFFELFTICVKLCRESDLLPNGLLTMSLMIANYFYGFGHQATIPAIRFEAAFIGFSGNWENKIIPAFLIHSNMFAAEIFFTFLVPLLILLPCTKGEIVEYFSFWRDSRENHWQGDFVMHENQKVFRHLQMKIFFSLYLYQGFKLSASILAAAIHKRHLMVWKIFAPRFVYQAMSTFTVFAVAIIVTMVLARVNSSLTKGMAKIKQNS
ncbi:GPI ethanolamine phosphate transferase 3-like [Mercenaria mercenaria]|uniref:GPI ethanolamine phosphate transferase 3-like n=1 Tax=Mercenaria mercenaria TaxID=6596 RepID=UPI00234F3728|nr:GPI ethanolamine phosphate transferase 3-like [Mercenaria mercenaria]